MVEASRAEATPTTPMPAWKVAAWAAPYAVVLYLAVSVSWALLLPAVLLCAAVFLAHERVYRGRVARFPMGWLLALLLLVPSIYTTAYGKLWLLPLVAIPALLLWGLHAATGGRLGRWWGRQPVFGTLLYTVATAGLLYGAMRSTPLPPFTDDVLFELYAAPRSLTLSHEEQEAAVAVVDAALAGYQRDTGDGVPAAVRDLEGSLPARLTAPNEHDVWVTLWIDRKAFLRGHAVGGTLAEDLSRATDQALDGTRRWRDWLDGAERVRIQIDVADEEVPIRKRPLHQLVLAVLSVFTPINKENLTDPGLLYQLIYEVEPGVVGMTLRTDHHEATILPGDPVTRGWLTPRVRRRSGKTEKILINLSREADGPRDLWSQEGTELGKFHTVCFGRPVPGGEVLPLYRGNVLLETGEVDSARILDGVEEAGGWLLRTVQPDGKFDYEYYPNTDSGSKGYNIVRHAGCVYGLFHMYELALLEPQLRDDANDYLEAAIRAMDWVYDNLDAPSGAEDEALVALVDRRQRASSGAAALTLMSFLERPAPEQVSHPVLRERLGRPEDEQIIEGLGLFLLEMIDARGKVYHSYRDRLASDAVEKEPLYFPGETMLALVRLYQATEDERWLEGSERIAGWQIERYWDQRPNPDHWVMQALWELYDVTGDERYARTGLAMGDRHASEQFPPNWAPFPDYHGCYRRYNDTPRTTRACSRSEAMGGVVHIAWKKDVDATTYEDALLFAADHLLENQWRPENSYYLPRPAKARGAIRMGIVDNHCRIDNNQHAVVGLHRALEVARRREGVAMPDQEVLPPVPSAVEQIATRLRFGESVQPLEEPETPPPSPPGGADTAR